MLMNGSEYFDVISASRTKYGMHSIVLLSALTESF